MFIALLFTDVYCNKTALYSACVDPPSVEPNKWDRNDITKWPVSKLNIWEEMVASYMSERNAQFAARQQSVSFALA